MIDKRKDIAVGANFLSKTGKPLQEIESGMIRIPYVKKFLNKTHYSSILTLAGGPGKYLNELSADYKLNIELWEPYAHISREYSDVVIADIRHLPLVEDFHFDLIIVTEIIEHLEKEESIELLKKIFDHGNEIIITTPIADRDRLIPGAGADANPLQFHKSSWEVKDVTDLGYTYLGGHPHGTDNAHIWKKGGIE